MLPKSNLEEICFLFVLCISVTVMIQLQMNLVVPLLSILMILNSERYKHFKKKVELRRLFKSHELLRVRYPNCPAKNGGNNGGWG